MTQAQNLQVNTTEGLVEGQKAVDGNYNVFYGIPYANRTDGENRFKVNNKLIHKYDKSTITLALRIINIRHK